MLTKHNEEDKVTFALVVEYRSYQERVANIY